MSVSMVLFTRDLRVRDNPALSEGCAAAERVVPLFVIDDALAKRPTIGANRRAFLRESLVDLHDSLTRLGGGLVVRRGDWLREVLHVARAWGVATIHVAEDVSGFARTRLDRLELEASSCGIVVRRHPGVTVVPPGAVTPATGDHYKVFTPYHRRWSDTPWRPTVSAPARVRLPAGLEIDIGMLRDHLVAGEKPSPALIHGGETAGLARLRAWSSETLERYDQVHNDLAGDATSRISAFLHFGCLSPAEVASVLRGREGAAAFVRQLCWRDFFHQVLAARPEAAHHDSRSRGDLWNVDSDSFVAWQEGRTGYPLVDAAMRQLRREGFMHNRARMVVASFLTKDLHIDWRLGAAHFMQLLVDGDVANNQLNWQWTAGTGTDSNPNRIFNPVVQGRRFDPTGDYIRRYLPELGDLDGDAIHWPGSADRERIGYPDPVVDHHEAIAAYRAGVSAAKP
jgi:deoxyribodipyrimidine photo-lyase